MAEVYVLETNPASRRARVLIHGNTPNGSNAAGYPFDRAMREYMTHYAEDGVTAVRPRSALPDLETINPTRWQQIQDGEVFEVVVHVWYDPTLPPAQARHKIKEKAEVLASLESERLTEILRYWGTSIQ